MIETDNKTSFGERAGAKLRVVRHGAYADAVRNYDIVVDGSKVGTIARNSTLELQVPSGEVTVEARIDWGRSQPLQLTMRPNQIVVVEVFNNWGATLSLWGITFGYRTYLALRRISA